MNAEGWVLAGGQSRRMGRDKTAVELAGTPLLVHMLNKLAALGLAARVAGLRDREGVGDRRLQAEIIGDAHPGCGPLSGLETALHHGSAPLLLTVGVDLPLLPVAFLTWLLARASTTGALATIPRLLGVPQPLCAVYRRELLGSVSSALNEGDFKVLRVIERGVVGLGGRMDLFDAERLASTGAWQSKYPLHLQFLNCNTPQDLMLAETLLARTPML